MSAPPGKRQRPRVDTGTESTTKASATTTTGRQSNGLPDETAVTGPVVAVAVWVKMKDDRERRCLFLSVAAAQRAVERAAARGVSARVRVCALVPLDGLE